MYIKTLVSSALALEGFERARRIEGERERDRERQRERESDSEREGGDTET